jgi:hypothetical protein
MFFGPINDDSDKVDLRMARGCLEPHYPEIMQVFSSADCVVPPNVRCAAFRPVNASSSWPLL